MSVFLDGAGEGGAVDAEAAAVVAAPQQQQHANREAAKLTFPDGVLVATRDAVLSFEAPSNCRIRELKQTQRSGVVFYGVKMDIVRENGEVDPHNKLFTCLASAGCRNARKILKLKGETTTGATSHLRDTHKITMEKTTVAAAK